MIEFKNKKIYIIGAGLSGSVVGRKLAESGYKVEIFEKKDFVGGNTFDYKKDGVLVHKFGPHIFHTSKQKVIDFIDPFWTLNGFKNVVDAYICGQKMPIPMNFKSLDIIYKNKSDSIKRKLLEFYPDQKSVTILELMNNEDKEINEIAKYIYDNMFLNYTTKMWDLKPDEIDVSVTSRIPILLSYKNQYFDDIYEGIPTDGYTNTIKRILQHENIKIINDFDAISKIKFLNNKLSFNDDENSIIIFTGAIDDLFDHKFGLLDYRSLDIQFKKINIDSFQKTAVVNYPSHKTMTRITEYKNMTKEIVEGKTVLSMEYPGKYDPNNERFNVPYYPIATNEARNKYNKYKEQADKYENLYLLGRLATYKYINMDQAIEDALILYDRIIEKYE